MMFHTPVQTSTNTAVPALAIEGLRITGPAEGAALVEDVSLYLAAGETLALIGESGSGKTLTAMALAGILPNGLTVTGQARLSGHPLRLAEPEKDRARRIASMGVVFQNPATVLNPRLTVRSHLLEALPEELRRNRIAAEVRCVELLDEVGILDARAKLAAFPHQLSGGQAQRLVIALAIARAPAIVIADEPTTALDATIQARILDLLDRLQRRHGFAILLITHDMALVHDRADRVAVMHSGRIVETGSTEQILQDPQHPLTRALLDGLTFAESAKIPAEQPSLPQTDPLIVLRALNKSFRRGTQVLRGISLSILPGEAVGIVGESGSGKTTLARIIAGLETASDGQIVMPRTQSDRLPDRLRIGYVFQDPYQALSPHLSLIASTAEPLIAQGVAKAEAMRRARQALLDVGLPEACLNQRPARLSGGQRQRVVIARAVIAAPHLLIADEPVAALDSGNKALVLRLLRDLRRRYGLTLLLISHDFGIVRDLCDRTVVMSAGRIVESGPTAQVLRTPNDPYTRNLLDAVPGRISRARRNAMFSEKEQDR